MSTKLKVKIEYEIEVSDGGTIPDDIAWLIREKVLTNLDYGSNLVWQMIPKSVRVRVRKGWL
jgi:hypothetical protein